MKRLVFILTGMALLAGCSPSYITVPTTIKETITETATLTVTPTTSIADIYKVWGIVFVRASNTLTIIPGLVATTSEYTYGYIFKAENLTYRPITISFILQVLDASGSIIKEQAEKVYSFEPLKEYTIMGRIELGKDYGPLTMKVMPILY